MNTEFTEDTERLNFLRALRGLCVKAFPMNLAKVGACLRGVMVAVALSAAGASAAEFTFADFCRENPTVTQPVGEQPIWIEWLVADAPELPEQPSAAMLQTGRVVLQVTRLNRCASTEQWQQVDRAPDGRRLAAFTRVGSALYTRVLPEGGGRLALVVYCELRRPSGWMENAEGRPEALCEGGGANASFTVSPGKWVKFGMMGSERRTKTADGKETGSKTLAGFYLRVVTKPESVLAAP